MAQTTNRRRHRKKRRSRQQTSPVVMLLILLASLMLLLLLFRLLFGQESPQPQEPVETELTSPVVTQTLPPSTLTAECFGLENGYKTYQSSTVTADLGIDVSSHQGWIDWQAVADSDVDFAMIRAGFRGYSDGGTNQDEYFAYNIESATACGLDVGIYYFSQALNEEEAIAEANQVLELVSGYELTYPIYFDWEPIDEAAARTDTISGSELTRCAQAFCSTIENAGYEAGIYFNLSLAVHLYHLYELKDYDFWLAEYQDTPSFPFAIQMWQYSNEGTVPGITDAVDLNLSFRNAS